MNTATTDMVKVNEIRVGDVILPPERELSLWMRRHAAEHGMSESALNLTVVEVKEGSRDKRGSWIIITTQHDEEWDSGRGENAIRASFTFKARPETNWPRIQEAR